MLAVRPMIDLLKLSGPTAGKAEAEEVSRALDPSTLLGVLFLLAAGLWLAARARRPGGLRVSPLGLALLLVGATALVSALGAERPSASLLEALRILTVVVMFVVLEQLVPEHGMARNAAHRLLRGARRRARRTRWCSRWPATRRPRSRAVSPASAGPSRSPPRSAVT